MGFNSGFKGLNMFTNTHRPVSFVLIPCSAATAYTI